MSQAPSLVAVNSDHETSNIGIVTVSKMTIMLRLTATKQGTRPVTPNPPHILITAQQQKSAHCPIGAAGCYIRTLASTQLPPHLRSFFPDRDTHAGRAYRLLSSTVVQDATTTPPRSSSHENPRLSSQSGRRIEALGVFQHKYRNLFAFRPLSDPMLLVCSVSALFAAVSSPCCCKVLPS